MITDYMHNTVFTDSEEAINALQAGNLDVIERSETVAFLMDEGVSSGTLAKMLGMKDYQLRHEARVGKRLAPEVKALVRKSKLSFAHARVIAGFNTDEQENIARDAMMHKRSVRSLEALRKGYDDRLDRETEKYFERLSTFISDHTGQVVAIKPNKNNKKAGEITIKYFDLTGFDSVCDRLGVDLSEL